MSTPMIIGSIAAAAILGAFVWFAGDLSGIQELKARCHADGGELANASGTIVCIDAKAILWDQYQ